MSYLVGIDAGHGMHTEGKRTPKLIADIKVDGKVVKKKGEIIHENEWNRAVAKYLAAALKRCGIDYFYTADMTGKTDVPLRTRAARANNKKCDILVSCHYNAFGMCSSFINRKGGLLVLRTKNCSSKSIKLGKLAAKHLANDIDYAYSYGLRRDVDICGFTLAILRQTDMPAILIEYGFMDVWAEAKLMPVPSRQKKCAEATCKAICEYFGVTYKKPDKEHAKEPTKEPATEPSKHSKGVYRVTTDELNVRKGPGVKFEKTNEVHKGDAFTIVEIDGNWGKLKSGEGWINLNYTEKVK